MTKHQLREIIQNGENSKVEFKRKLNSSFKIAKEICALANSSGGVIIIGVDDDGTVVGIESEKYEYDLVIEACRFYLSPNLEPEIIHFDFLRIELLVVIIKESMNKPIKVKMLDKDNKRYFYRAYIRMGEKSVMASSEMARALRYQNNIDQLTISIGEKEKSLMNYLNRYEKITVMEFAKLVNISRRRAERLMIRLIRAGVLQIHNDSHHDYFTLKP